MTASPRLHKNILVTPAKAGVHLFLSWIPAFAGIAAFFFLIGVAPALAAMSEYPKVRLRSLDKITARTMTFDAKVGTTIKFGSIYIKIQSCQKPDLQDMPEAASFLQVWEITPEDQSKWIFSGWMFASSPAVSAMDHPIYDVWVIDCLGNDNKSGAPKVESTPATNTQKTDAPTAENPAPDAPATDDTDIEQPEPQGAETAPLSSPAR
jgi:hypothetical protein